MNQLTFAELTEAVNKRDNMYPRCGEWTINDWAVALAGEVGELLNMLKKVRRGDYSISEKETEIAHEFADIQIYLAKLASECWVDLAAATVEKFNLVSDKKGCDVKL